MNRKSLMGAALSGAAGIVLFAGVAFAQSAPAFLVELDVSPHVTPGTRSTVALIKLDASNTIANAKVSSLNLSSSYSGGTGQNTLRSCSLALANAIGTALNTGGNVVTNFGNSSTFTFDT